MKTMMGYHFMADRDGAPVLRDGSPCPAKGVTLKHAGPLAMCSAGYHASRCAIDALEFAPGPWVARVRLSGEIAEGTDKAVATERTITAGPIDATAVLREFAAACAYHALERYGGKLTADQMDACLWAVDIAAAMAAGADIPEEERAAARDAARAAAWDAAGAAENKMLERMLKEAGL